MLSSLDKQLHFYLLIQDRLLQVMHDDTAEGLTEDELKEEQERETLHFATLAVREWLLDKITALDTLVKVKRLRKRLEAFQKSDSLADIDILDKLQKMDPIIDELLESKASLPDMEELSQQIQEVHLLYRQLTKEAIRSRPDAVPSVADSLTVDHEAYHQTTQDGHAHL